MCLDAEVDSAPVGFSMVDVEDDCVFAVFLLPGFEGRGLGRSLMSKAEAILFQHHQTIMAGGLRSEPSEWLLSKPRLAIGRKSTWGDVRFEKRLNNSLKSVS
ncbi:GNAT family N-acetyltransferase [Xanthomonas campestris]|uniref:GNAT family N-acetyltransferase n=1 Tax=Xanthomonas arboricola TaxID=56448 RepID=UPI0006990827